MSSIAVIKTGVDKLVELVRIKRKISVGDAAKSLGVSPTVVEEWADFLEEENIISIEHKFATRYLIQRRMTTEEIKNKETEFHGKKEGFIRKVESTLAILDRDGDLFQGFKASFEKMKKELSSELSHVESELKQLEKFELLKRGIDQQIMEQENTFQKKMDEYESAIGKEQQKYQELVDSINLEEEKLDMERLEAISLREKEINLGKKIQQFRYDIDKISDKIKEDDSLIENAGSRISSLKKLAERIKKDIDKKKTLGKNLIDESKKHKAKILNLQGDILKKAEKQKAEIDKQILEGKTSAQRFRQFFNKKLSMDKMITNLEKEKNALEEELILIIRKAKAFHLSSKSSELNVHVKDLEGSFQEVELKKKQFEKEAAKLASVFE